MPVIIVRNGYKEDGTMVLRLREEGIDVMTLRHGKQTPMMLVYS